MLCSAAPSAGADGVCPVDSGAEPLPDALPSRIAGFPGLAGLLVLPGPPTRAQLRLSCLDLMIGIIIVDRYTRQDG